MAMERPVQASGAGSAAMGAVGASLPGAANATAAPTGAPALQVGQVIHAAVLATTGDRVRLRWQGQLMEAISSLLLRPGHTYQLRVAATSPQVVLSTGRSVPEASVAAAVGLLGAAEAAWRQPAGSLATGLPPDPTTAAGGDALAGFAQVLARLRHGSAAGADLQRLHHLLGHDQEARVLRLSGAGTPADAAREVAELRMTHKARALAVLAEPAADPVVRQQARALVVGLNAIERDNSVRAEQGAAAWLPIPAAPAVGLLDARMFLLPRDRGGGSDDGGPGERAFTVVLLLDLSRLGGLRVDVAVRNRSVDVLITATAADAVAGLAAAVPDLRTLLEQADLEVTGLRVQQAPADTLPVADLVVRPRDLDTLVDLHA